MKESAIVSSFLARVKALAKDGVPIKAVKVHGGMWTSGQPDVCMCYSGKMIQIEFKQPGKKPTDRQEGELESWKKAGAIIMVATDPITPLVTLGLVPASEASKIQSRIESAKKLGIPENFDQPGG